MVFEQSHIYWQMWPTLAAIVVIVGLFCSGRFQIAALGIGILISLLMFFQMFPVEGPDGKNLLGPAELLSGFSNPALITILALLVLGQGLFQSGALDIVVEKILQLSGTSIRNALILSFAIVFILSAFVNDTPVVVMFLPIISAIAQRSGVAASRVLMPLSMIAVLGGMTTLIGTSTNILVAGAAEKLSGFEIGFFDQTPMGIILGLVGVAYLAILGPKLLPVRQGLADEIFEDGKQFLIQIAIIPGHPLIGATATAGLFKQLPDLTVRMVLRGEHAFLPPFEDVELQARDRMIVAATRRSITNFMTASPELLSGIIEGTQESLELANQKIAELHLSEVVISPSSRMIGRTLEDIGFHKLTGAVAMGIQRRSRMIGSAMDEINLEAGDVLLVLGTRASLRELRKNRDVLILEWQTSELPTRMYAGRARAIFALVIAMAASGLVDMVAAALFGAGLMMITGVLNLRQAIRAFDVDIFFLVSSAIAVAAAMRFTGGADFIAYNIVNIFLPMGPLALLSAFFLIVALMTNLLTNNATAILFTPIAISVGEQLGGLEMAFLFAVIFGANMSFATPFGYQTNLLIMGPGHYKFTDFGRLGLPLLIILWIVFTAISPLFFPKLIGG